MSESQVIDLVVSQAEISSVADASSKIKTDITKFGRKWEAEFDVDPKKVEEDLIQFFVKRKQTNLTILRVSILEDGSVAVGDNITGRRKADLIFRISYKQGGAVKA